ncbi:hypothetical protein N8631_01195 [Verrucomicrobiales bacterium]|nr:hypothetical protein [Verrucomicrobiales bacterium]
MSSIIISADNDSRELTIIFGIEESEDLINWIPVEGNHIKTIDVSEAKRFHGFVLEKLVDLFLTFSCLIMMA